MLSCYDASNKLGMYMYLFTVKKTTILTVIAKLKVKLSSYRKSSLRGNNFTQTFSACYNNRLIQATILNNIFTVVSLYAPNNNDPALCHTFSLKYLILLETSTAFDTVLNTLIDRSSHSANIRHSQSAKIITGIYLEDVGLSLSILFSFQYNDFLEKILFFLTGNSVFENSFRIHPKWAHPPHCWLIFNHLPQFNISLLMDLSGKSEQTSCKQMILLIHFWLYFGKQWEVKQSCGQKWIHSLKKCKFINKGKNVPFKVL